MSEIDHVGPAALYAKACELELDQRFEDVERLARAGLKLAPENQQLRMLLAYTLLMLGRYKEGFREHEARVHRQLTPARKLPWPEWQGPIGGRSIVVWGEQGIGDELMMLRYIATLRELGASRITVACWPQLARVFEQSGADHIVSRLGTVSLPKHDYWVSALSLPHRLGLDFGDLSGAPYLRAEPRGGGGGGGGIGLVERGRPDNPRDAERSIPTGMLQRAIPDGRLMQPDGDVYDAMCRLAGLDLLVTVDTSWAHMAGALGVPCWVLLPYRRLDWRWGRDRSDTPWYSSLKLFRQPQAGDWSTPIGRVVARLQGSDVV